MSAVFPDLVAKLHDKRLGSGKAANTVRPDLALLGHLYAVAMRKWGIGLDILPHWQRMQNEDLEAKFKNQNQNDPLRLVFVCAI